MRKLHKRKVILTENKCGPRCFKMIIDVLMKNTTSILFLILKFVVENNNDTNYEVNKGTHVDIYHN